MSDIFLFMDTQTLTIALFVLLVWNIVLTYKFFRSNDKQEIKNSPNIDSGEIKDVVANQSKIIEEMNKKLRAIDVCSREGMDMAKKGLQNLGVVRFNPFKDVGGDQSFAIALLDSSGNGLTISSLYSREGTRIYAKPIKDSTSPYQLSGEEKEAVAGAMSKAVSK